MSPLVWRCILHPGIFQSVDAARMATADEKKSMVELEGWIEQLMECKQLSENQVSWGSWWEVWDNLL